MIPPETQYTKVEDGWVGYQVVGEGPIDLVYLTGVASNIDTIWDWPAYARALERLASYSRLILFDPRGSGISDGIPLDRPASWEYMLQDVRAVLAAAKSDRTAIFAQYDGGLSGLLFAATYPEQTSALILWNGYARTHYAEDYPIGNKPENVEVVWDLFDQIWGRSVMMQLTDPSKSGDPQWVRAATKFQRTAMSPRRATLFMRHHLELDARPALASVRVPTLVLASNNNYMPVSRGRYVADHIPGARFVELPGSDLNYWAEHADIVLDEIEEFLTGSRRAVAVDRVLATVLFTDIVGSTEKAAELGDRRWKELLTAHDRTAGTEIERFQGKLVNRMGDGVLATFDGPGRAIRCAHALGRALEPDGIAIRAGLHTGEIELRDEGEIGGIAVHIASRVMHEAGPGEVICSRTVKDLVAGSEFAFDDHGMCTLKGVPDEWQLYAVRPA
jgi:class 3 adenylate cyclase